jgi:hypothetical protein
MHGVVDKTKLWCSFTALIVTISIFSCTSSSMKKPDLSLYTLILIAIVLVWFVGSHIPRNVIVWDVFGYYLYLPFTFIYNDLGLTNFSVVEQINEVYNNTITYYQAMKMPEGYWVMKYPMGMAILYLPWFAVGHIWAVLGGFEADGFSNPYQMALLYGSLIYTLIGLIYFRRSMLRFFSPLVVSILLIAVVFGTNFLVHTVFHGQGLMSHNYLFFTFSLILWFTIRWHEQPKLKYAAFLGVLIGVSALSRPTEILVLAVPVLWGIAGRESLVSKIQLLLIRWKDVALLAVIVIFFGSLQLIYFKVVTGKFLFNSYGGNPGEGMEFLRPYIWQVLVSYRKGWLVYTPLMTLALLGFVSLFKSHRHVFYSILLFFLMSFYVIASWSCWWYADCFSQRALIPMYVFLAIPLGAFIAYFLRKKGWLNKAVLLLIPILIAFNLFQSWQFLKGIIHSSRMTPDYYHAVFLKRHIPEDSRKLLLIDRNMSPQQILNSGIAFRERRLVHMTFDEIGVIPDTNLIDGVKGKVIRLNTEQQTSPQFEIPYADLRLREYGILKIRARVLSFKPVEENPFVIKAAFIHNGFAYNYKLQGFTSDKFTPGQWNTVEMLYLTPEVRRPENLFLTSVWLRGNHPVFVDDFKVSLLIPQK